MSDEYLKDDGGLEKTPGLEPPSGSTTSLDDYLDYAFREQGGAGYTTPLVNSLKTVRLLGPGNQQIPIPDDTIGLVFVTRPLLNLSDENVIKHPQLVPLYSPQKNSVMSYIKGLLDKEWGDAHADGDLLDHKSAWIAPITNYIKTSSGFPDISLNVGKTNAGFRGEVMNFVDGTLKFNGDFDITQNYYISKPNFMPYIFEAWVHYIEAVTLGDEGIEPHYQALDQNYRDFDCRIYHIILNKNMRNIEWIFCSGSSFPYTFPSGAFSTIDRTGDTLRGQGQDEFSINFSSVGFRFGNVRVAKWFNEATVFFNPEMADGKRDSNYKKIAFSDLGYMYSNGKPTYPYINLNTMEIEYWGNK